VKLNLGSGYSGNDALYVCTQRQTNPDWIFVDVAGHYAEAARGCGRFDCYDFSDGIREPDASIDGVWMGDVLEHIYKWKTRFVLEECFRVMKPGTEIAICVPDMTVAMQRWLDSDGADTSCADLLWGQQDERDRKNCGPDSHHNGFTQGSLFRLLGSVGFVHMARVKLHDNWFELSVTARKPV